jgi:hypothetical protein
MKQIYQYKFSNKYKFIFCVYRSSKMVSKLLECVTFKLILPLKIGNYAKSSRSKFAVIEPDKGHFSLFASLERVSINQSQMPPDLGPSSMHNGAKTMKYILAAVSATQSEIAGGMHQE